MRDVLQPKPTRCSTCGRYSADDVDLVRWGPLVVNLVGAPSTLNGERLHLTKNEDRMLKAIAAGRGRTVSREDMARAVWGEGWRSGSLQNSWSGSRNGRQPVEFHSLRVLLTRLRTRLGEAGALIETVKGEGWRLAPLTPEALELSRPRALSIEAMTRQIRAKLGALGTDWRSAHSKALREGTP